MGLALYRKYRPQTFADVTGQNHLRVTLENELRTGSVAHAYLLNGPRGVGKTTVARIFAKALNCVDRKKGASEPCNRCAACEEQTAGRSLDVIEIDAASNTGVDHVRENIIEHVRFAPVARAYKVFIIDEVHMLSTAAWNALLKTLEEPPAHAVFIMATTELHKVPSTILSRCQRFDFRRIPVAEMAARLKHLAVGEGVTVDDAVLEGIARQSDGCLRDAESLLEQVLALGEKRIGEDEAALVLPRSNRALVAEFLSAIARRSGADSIALVNRLVEEGVDLQQFALEAIESLRALLLRKLGAAVPAEETDATARLGVAHLIRLIESLIAARAELKTTPIPQLPLELVAAAHCGDAPLVHAATPAPAPAAPPAPVHPPPPKKGNEVPEREAAGKPKTKAKPLTEANVPLETLALRWDELCAAVQDENPSLPFLLRIAKPLRYEDGALIIGVQYKMHAEKLNGERNRMSIERGLTGLFEGATIPVRVEIAVEDGSAASEPPVSSLLKEFGGTVVE